ncbi:hypothetical protein ID853_17430 [Xenorhabdus sp. Vera]|uniref:hypothetical protein n=1 Tax=Xenorhabdus koppenhoeferi TaxID=351659 RepID=UPI00199A7BC8|nr:hypothetical protein [Xenorhabdus sp. Vera]MBD2812609.1 hypothetical protein [Xenorhabdus sp. Vera]
MRTRTFVFRVKKEGREYYVHEFVNEGKELSIISKGNLDKYYDVMFSFVMEGRTFILGHDAQTRWCIFEMDEDGKLSSAVSSGTLDDFYPSLLSYQIDGKVYIFGQSKKTNKWFIREIILDAVAILDKKDIRSGEWNTFYPSMFTYSIDDSTYLFAQTDKYSHGGYYWFIQRLLPGGKLDSAVRDGNGKNWGEFYQVLFPITFKDKVYIFGHTRATGHGGHYWFIQELLPDGTLDSKVLDGNDKNWKNFWKTLPFTLNGRGFIYGQNSDDNRCFTQEVYSNGVLAETSTDIDEKDCFDVQVVFSTYKYI